MISRQYNAAADPAQFTYLLFDSPITVLFPFLAFRFFPYSYRSPSLFLFSSFAILLTHLLRHASFIHLTFHSPSPLQSYVDIYFKPVPGSSRSSVTSRLPFETYRRHPFTHSSTHPLTHSPTMKTAPGQACSVTTRLPFETYRRRIVAYRPDHPPLNHCLLTFTLLPVRSSHVGLISGGTAVYLYYAALLY